MRWGPVATRQPSSSHDENIRSVTSIVTVARSPGIRNTFLAATKRRIRGTSEIVAFVVDVDLDDRRAGSPTGVDDVGRDVDTGSRRAGESDRRDVERRVAEPVTEREQRLDSRVVVPAIADEKAFAVHGSHAVARVEGRGGCAVEGPWERDRETSAGLDVAGQHVDEGRPDLPAGKPDLQHRRDLVEPRHRDRRTAVEHDHGPAGSRPRPRRRARPGGRAGPSTSDPRSRSPTRRSSRRRRARRRPRPPTARHRRSDRRSPVARRPTRTRANRRGARAGTR